jgi:Protein of unknown function (DUF3631)/RepB DNA-primase N-terminal domain
MSDLIDADTVREFCTLLHARAAAALAGVDDPTAIIQLCHMLPDGARMLSAGFRVGDAEHMAQAAIDYASAGYNVYVEGRTVRPGCGRRGTAAETRGVFGLVVERDADTGKAGRPLPGEPSAVVETSPGNCHEWLFLRHALTAAEGKRVGDALRAATGADSGTGVVTQPFRLPGTPNYPNAKKRARGRVVVPTRIARVTDKVWAHTELLATFPPAPPSPPAPPPAAKPGKRTSTRVATKAARKATARMDRSAHFQSTVAAAVSSGLTPDELEVQLRAHPEGCVSKYLEGTDRLRAEIDRSWAKAASRGKPAPSAAVTPDPNADGAVLLEDMHAFLARFIAYPSEDAHVAHTLWAAHTHLMDVWETTPRIAFLSAESQSGKTRALEVTELLVPRPVKAVNVSVAYLFRKVGAAEGLPTVLYDEVDTVFGAKAAGSSEEIRGLLNAGSRKGAVAGRCVMDGRTVRTEEIPAYSALALAGIGDLPDTILNRSVIVRMRRRSPGERVEPYRPRLHDAEGHALRDRLAAWAAGVAPRITAGGWPTLPETITDRAADMWETLVAVADVAGGRWPDASRVAGVSLVLGFQEEAREVSRGARLLSDIRTVFEGYDVRSTDTLLKELHACPESLWADIRGKPLSDIGLASRLRPYGIRPRTLRIGSATPRGYIRVDFEDAWTRYLPPVIPQKATTPATPKTFPCEEGGK